MDKQKVIFKDLGIIEYKKAWDYQESLLQQNVSIKSALRNAASISSNNAGAHTQQIPHTTNYFLLCEHPPVYTLGKSGKIENVLMSNEELAANGIAFFNTNRGGDITFHGLQQIVGYPILDLENYQTDIGKYLRNLEEVIILSIGEYGIKGQRSKGETGVWIDAETTGRERKICAIGVRCSRWITMHGFALNVNTNLDYFNNIIPCGIKGKQVTSLQKELGYYVDYNEVKEKIKKNFEIVFNSNLI
ncbi:MAG: lipoyl(octanoyl) transferase LipB [Ferruginibacter sp.]|nr:lipoyl(octanoyl) transferase LipB [Bacteroidota bacterium]MBX2919386.1 lipoyl(octanoyl) transferase LipB [Ferruginibacter sp.]MCB0709531.1 lipoyl(octanoyl) transferase LipB [Chitinophagaceae bacterium]MCC7378304.1 lipoyl(octanoyl) transferase LipB [Chitinophagaceae bacterium]